MFPVTLTGPRVTLREFRTSDAPAVYAYASDPIVSVHLPWSTHANIDETHAYLSTAMTAARSDERAAFHLAATVAGESGDDELIGSGRISVRNAHDRVGDIGYVLHPGWWARGIGTEIAAVLIAFGLDQFGLRRIEATAHPDNIGSQRVLAKVGMRYQRQLREHMWVDGQWRDSVSYAISDTGDRSAIAQLLRGGSAHGDGRGLTTTGGDGR